MSSSVADLFVVLDSVTDPFSRGMKAAAADAEAQSHRMSSALGLVTKAAVGIGAAAIGVGVASVKMATDFQAKMTLLNTQAGVAKGQIAGLSDGVLNLAGQVGFAPNSLADALFHIESSFASTGITGSQALNLLKVAAEGAAVGHADLVDVTNALDSAVVSGIPGVQNLTQAMGVLNATVGAGDMQMQDLADAFSTGLLASVKGYGLTFRDVGAALAVFGDNNIRGQVAATDLRMAVQSLAVPAKTGGAELTKLGLASDALAKDMQAGGLLQALQDLKKHMDAAGVSTKQQGQILTEVFGKKAGVGINILYDQLDRLQSKYPDMARGANGFSAAWEQTKQTFAQQLREIGAGADALGVRLGTFLIPQLSKLITLGQSDLGQLASGFSGSDRKVASPGAGNAFLNKEQSSPPDVTGWQRFGEEVHSVLTDIEDGAKRLEPIGEDFVRFGDDAWQALQKIEPVALTVGHDLGVGLYLGAEAAGTVFKDVLGPAIKLVAGFIGDHQVMIRIFADVVIGGLALKMGTLGAINAAKGLIGLASAVMQFPVNQAGEIKSALDGVKTAWTGKEAAESEQAVKGLSEAFGDLKSKASGVLDKVLPDAGKLTGLAQMSKEFEAVKIEAQAADEQMALFATTEKGIVQAAPVEQLGLFEQDLSNVKMEAANSAKNLEGAAVSGGKAGTSILGMAGSFGKAVLPMAAIITGAGLLGSYLGHLAGVGRSMVTDMDAFTQSLSQAASGSQVAQTRITQFVQAINAAPFHTGAASMGDVDKALTQLVTSGHAMDAQTEFDQITRALEAQGVSAQDAAAKFPGYEQALKDVTSAAQSADGQVQGLLGTLAQQQAVDQFQSDLNNLSGAIMANGHALTGNSDAAIANRQAISQAASDVENYYNTQRNAGVSIEKASADMQVQVDQLETTAIQAGFTKGEVDAYLKSLGLIPRDVATQVTLNVDTGPAYQALHGLIQSIDNSVGYVQITGTGGGMYGGGRAYTNADGGPVRKGQLSWVGERGPELVVFGSDGYVVPNEMLTGKRPMDPRVLSGLGMRSAGFVSGFGGGGATVVNYNITVQVGGVVGMSVDQLVNVLRSEVLRDKNRNSHNLWG